MTIRIGKSSDNDYVINDTHVSRYHAQLFWGSNGRWVLEDLDSSNGTFVNGHQIARKELYPTDEVVLGGGYVLDISAVLKSRNDYSEEFKALRNVYDSYIQEKIKIQSSNLFKTRVFQSIPFAMIGVIGLVIGLLGKGSSVLLVISLIVAICAPAIGIYLGAKQSSKTPLQLQEIINQFKIDYVCPKCGVFLGEIPWESLRNRKQCTVPTCKAKWTKE
ncbi:FHA domain-containing protein [Parabacteroides sp. OttesenSCG-928-G07]|nr:FHA domain-containing protein [Parabacteroides sp. OttesenSCG-928-G07]